MPEILWSQRKGNIHNDFFSISFALNPMKKVLSKHKRDHNNNKTMKNCS